MRLDVRHNVEEARKAMTDVQREHLPFAVSVALNDVVKGLSLHMKRRMSQVLDRPVAFTRNGMGMKLSSKRNLSASVFVKDRQAAYLIWQETGGTRTPKGKAIPVPVKIRRNAAGNMARAAVKNALARKDTFATRPGSHLPGGIYQRTGGKRRSGLKMLLAFEPKAAYRDRPLKFGETVSRLAADRLPGALARAISAALAPRG